MLNFKRSLLILSSLLSLNAFAAKPIALVYDGPGSCSGSGILGCTGAAAYAAQDSGYQTVLIKPDALSASSTESDYQKIFKGVSVWVQPGGSSMTFLKTASPELKSAIRRFVTEGGGYVGFCAGAFSATAFDGSSTVPGLNIFPGQTSAYVNETMDTFFDHVVSSFNDDALNNFIYAVNWSGKTRYLYFEEGTRLLLSADDLKTVEVTAVLKSGDPVSARTTLGKGRVYITGLHPEAPYGWRTNPNLNDPDGLDYDLVKNMLNWASGQTTTEQALSVKPYVEPLTQNDGKYLGLAAHYVTKTGKSGGTQTVVGKTDIVVTAYDQATDTYSLQITNTNAITGASTQEASSFSTEDFDEQLSGSLITSCTLNYGVMDNQNHCKFSSSNTDIFGAALPFGIDHSISMDRHGVVYTTSYVTP